MTPAATLPDFFRLLFGGVRSIPRRGLAYLVIAGAAVSVSDWLVWWSKPDAPAIIYGGFAGLVLCWGLVLYAVSMMVMDKRASLGGFVRFSITSLAMVLPLLLSAGLLLLTAAHGNGWGIALSGTLFAVSLAAPILLPGWPVLQATSTGFVGPLNALRATRGIRWSLFIASLVVSGINRAVPDVGAIEDAWAAMAVAVFGGLIAVLAGMISISIATASAKFMLAANYEPERVD